MDVVVDRQSGVSVVRLSGDVDLQTSPKVRKALLDILGGSGGLVVDLGGVTYIDSSGIASLVEAYQTARKAGTVFSLAQVSPAAMRVLQLARLDKVFTFHDTVDTAVAAAQAG